MAVDICTLTYIIVFPIFFITHHFEIAGTSINECVAF